MIYVIQYLSGVSVSFDDICQNFCQTFPLRVIFQQIQILQEYQNLSTTLSVTQPLCHGVDLINNFDMI